MKTSELIGRALNWAVCLAEGNSPVINPRCFGGVSLGAFESELGYAVKNYCTDWSQGGPIIEREGISWHCGNKSSWHAYGYGSSKNFNGPTPLIASMRCYVASKLGDEIDIPEELK